MRAVSAAAGALGARVPSVARLTLCLHALAALPDEEAALLESGLAAIDVAALEIGELPGDTPFYAHVAAGRLSSLLARLPGLRELDAYGIGSLHARRVRRHGESRSVSLTKRISHPCRCGLRHSLTHAARSSLLNPPRTQPTLSIWGPHSRLSSLPALVSLRVCCLPDGAGLPELARAATALTRLTSLTVDVYASRPPTFPAGDLVFIGAALTRLRSLTVPLTASLEWLPPLQALTSLRFGGRGALSPDRLAPLVALPALCALRFGSWSAGGGDAAQPAAMCTAVTRLVCRAIHPQALFSLQRAFPAVVDAELGDQPRALAAIFSDADASQGADQGASQGAANMWPAPGDIDLDGYLSSDDADDAGPGLAGFPFGLNVPGFGHVAAQALHPPPLGALALGADPYGPADPGPRWRGLLRLSLSGFPIGADLQPLRRLGALDGGLLALKLSAALSGAQLAALLDAAPRLQALFVAALRHFGFSRQCGHSQLAVLAIGQSTVRGDIGLPPSMQGVHERLSLLGLGRVLPDLEMLILPDEATEARWLGALGVDVPRGADEPPTAAASALSSGLWHLRAARVEPAVRLVRALRAVLEVHRADELRRREAEAAQAAAQAAERAAATYASMADVHANIAAHLHEMAEKGQITWDEAEARVNDLLLLPPAMPDH
jgi:hypothetical protein